MPTQFPQIFQEMFGNIYRMSEVKNEPYLSGNAILMVPRDFDEGVEASDLTRGQPEAIFDYHLPFMKKISPAELTEKEKANLEKFRSLRPDLTTNLKQP